MRLLLVPVFGGVAALLAAPTAAQPALPARVFEPSLAAVAPDPAPPVTEWWRTGGPRIRPTDRRGHRHLQRGRRAIRTPACAGVDRVESSDVFVYVGMDPRMADGLAGVLTFVGHAGPVPLPARRPQSESAAPTGSSPRSRTNCSTSSRSSSTRRSPAIRRLERAVQAHRSDQPGGRRTGMGDEGGPGDDV